MRFAPPDLDPRNRVSDEKIRIPITVEQPDRDSAATLTALTVDASFDDGRTWRPLAVTLESPTTATAEVTHPRGPSYVSLRAKATDAVRQHGHPDDHPRLRKQVIHACRAQTDTVHGTVGPH